MRFNGPTRKEGVKPRAPAPFRAQNPPARLSPRLSWLPVSQAGIFLNRDPLRGVVGSRRDLVAPSGSAPRGSAAAGLKARGRKAKVPVP